MHQFCFGHESLLVVTITILKTIVSAPNLILWIGWSLKFYILCALSWKDHHNIHKAMYLQADTGIMIEQNNILPIKKK